MLQHWARLGTILMKYSKATSLDLHLTDYTQMKWAHMLPPFVFMMGGYMYWTMLPRCWLPIVVLQQMIKVN